VALLEARRSSIAAPAEQEQTRKAAQDWLFDSTEGRQWFNACIYDQLSNLAEFTAEKVAAKVSAELAEAAVAAWAFIRRIGFLALLYFGAQWAYRKFW
jgi:hypothetical protein